MPPFREKTEESDEPEEENGPGVTQPPVTAEARAAANAKDAALGLEGIQEAADWVEKQLRSVTMKWGGTLWDSLRFECRPYVEQLLRSSLKDCPGGVMSCELQERLVCGGFTQAGKTMFVVVALLAGFAVGLPSIVITTTVRGTASLHNKVMEFLLPMEDKDVAACCKLLSFARAAQPDVWTGLGGSSLPHLRNRGALFVADNCNQVGKAVETLYKLRRLAEDPARAADIDLLLDTSPQLERFRGRFLLHLDEADAMQRTSGEPAELIKLERQLHNLMFGGACARAVGGPAAAAPPVWHLLEVESTRAPRTFAPAVCLLQISATLLPVFLKAGSRLEKGQGGGGGGGGVAAMHVFFTTWAMENYLGVLSEHWSVLQLSASHPALAAQAGRPREGGRAPAAPLAAAAAAPDAGADTVMEAADADAADAQPDRLVDVYLRNNEFVAGQEAKRARASSQRENLHALRFTPRVQALYEHAAEPQTHTVTGALSYALLLDITVSRVSEGVDNNVNDKAALVCRTFPTFAVLTVTGGGARLYLPEGVRAAAAAAEGAPATSQPLVMDHPVRASANKRVVYFIDLPRKHVAAEVGDLLKWMEKGGPLPRKARADTPEADKRVHASLPGSLAGHPFAVLGYSMMVRGDSFRSDTRLPTHMVNSMSNATSLDRLVQSAGRASFQGLKQLLDSGFGRVRVLMSEGDFRAVRAYVSLMEEIRARLMGDGQPRLSLEDALAKPFRADLAWLAADDQKRRVGNAREHLSLAQESFEGHAERLAAAQEVRLQAEREKERTAEAKLARAAAAQEKKAAAAGGATPSAPRGGPAADPALALAWAANQRMDALAAGSTGLRIPSGKGMRSDNLTVLRLGTLQAAPQFQRRTRLVPAYFLSRRSDYDWRSASPKAKCLYLQLVEVSEDGQPVFYVWPQNDPNGSVLRPAESEEVFSAPCADQVWAQVKARNEQAKAALAPPPAAAAAAAAAASAQPTPVASLAGSDDEEDAGEDAAAMATPQQAAGGGGGGGGSARKSSGGASVRSNKGYFNFGLDSPYVQALLERQGMAALVAGEQAYVPLQQRFDAELAARGAGAAPAGEGPADAATDMDAS